MALFLSNYTNKIDKKGRISVPANFRNTLLHLPFQGIVVYPSFVNNCIEACGIDRIEQLSESIDTLDPFSEERDAFATAILGDSVQLPFDGEGRVMLPAHLIEMIDITEKAAFVGKGKTFEIWNPEAYEEYANNARSIARKQRGHLRLRPSQPQGEGAQ